MLNIRSILFFVGTCCLFAACEDAQEQESTTYSFDMEPLTIDVTDPNSAANFSEVAVTHLDWDAVVNFDTKTIEATALWTIDNKAGSEKLILDTDDLTIKNVTLDGGEKTQFELKEEHPIYGRALEIEIFPETKQVAIEYATSPAAYAVQWLNPQQTAGKEQPFLFTQSQAILARTWLPCQDGPGVRFTYNANVQVPEGLMALMSAENPTEKSDNGAYSFKMEQPIPSYLFALSVGDLAFQKIGSNSGVYAEPSVVAAAAKEFEDLPKMIKAAEALYGPYRWGQYDIIVLPPSFPYGGMENPRLTFATPTILAGDKSLTSLVAHELAHSWSGNLVTNTNWEEFWLNEGFTVYFEQRIMEAIYGREYSEMLASLEYEGLKEEIESFRANKTLPDTRLKVELEGRDPEETFSGIPYNKGYLFLRNIEETVGREKFDAFLKEYFDAYGFKVMNTEAFIQLLNIHLIEGDETIAEQLNLNEWIFEPGLPAKHPIPTSDKFAEVEKLITDDMDYASIKETAANWSTHEWLRFVNKLPRDIGTEKMAQLDETLDLTNSTNAEIQAAWYKLAIANQYEAAYPNIEAFLVNVGRYKFLGPLYTEFAKTPGGLVQAIQIYEKARPNYHSVSSGRADKVLGLVK
ncbi:MAG: M1 family metallopeptidase [Saprospiraceae bacterium]|nr:M1 family metallopeptidase [Saprospiraceae bacterium]